jgi:hypothetical protein
MATKTVVCPECGSDAERGRYACSECGALLAAVAIAPRVNGSAVRTDLNARVADPGEIAPAAAVDADADELAQPVPAPSTTAGAAAIAADSIRIPTTPVEATDAGQISSAPGPAGESEGGAAAFDENAPLAATIRSSSTPNVLQDLVATARVDDESAIATAPSWPPPGDRGPIPTPEPRTPAGAYLPPSAVLPPLDSPTPIGGAVPAAREPDSALATWASRSSAALSDALESVHITADASRRAVAAGAGLSALGLLLPWVNALPGANPLAGYFDRWGLAGPGLWLVFAGLVVLTAIAGSSGRTASWPVGLPAVATGAFLVGLVWPYIMGGFGRSIGIWVVLVGAAVLVVGGLLDRRGRHDGGDATV